MLSAVVGCDDVVVATPRREARRLLRTLLSDGEAERVGAWLAEGGDDDVRAPLSSACVYFALDHAPPVTQPILVLNGEVGGEGEGGGASEALLSGAIEGGAAGGGGVVNTVCFPSLVSPEYAPRGQHLASVGVVGAEAVGRADLEGAVRAELARWFGADEVGSWRHLRTYKLPQAQEARPPPNAAGFNRPPRVKPGVFVCGDHCGTPSLNGALRSGRVAAEALLADSVAWRCRDA